MTLLLDDQLLSAHLRGRRIPGSDGGVSTTGYWYVRLCLAVARHRGGALSGPFAVLPADERRRAVAAVLQLPEEVGLLSLRHLAPTIGDLASEHPPLNLLAREALAAAVVLRAPVAMASGNENPSLAAALGREGLDVLIVEP